MLVWILQTGEPLNCDGNQLRSMRAINLSKELVSKGHRVEIISTRFFHQEKRFRGNIKKKIKWESKKLSLILLDTKLI